MTPAPSTAVKVSRSHRSTRVRDFIYRARFIKTKTKAKKRYLRAKKDRKKHRKAAAARSVAADGTFGRDGDDAGEDIDSNDDERLGGGHTSNSDGEPETVVVDVGAQAERESTSSIQRQPRKKKQPRKEKSKAAVIPSEDGDDVRRPRKRRKLDREDASPSPSHPSSSPSPSPPSPVSSSPNLPDESPPLDRRSHTPTPPPPSLPRFPLPSRPRAPEKSELVSQGLDGALARAQLVDPQLTTPLSLDENGGDVTGLLSARTIRRLRDLGITELFAGNVSFRFSGEKPGLDGTI